MKKEFKIMSDEDLFAWNKISLKQEKELNEKLKMFDGQRWEGIVQECAKMNIYKCSQTDNQPYGHRVLEAYICYANTEDEALDLMPYGILLEEYNAHGYWCRWKYQAKAELIGNGDSSKAKIILEQWHEAERMGM